ncbi:DNA glycosylase AlkZ-like family protein [Amycolatopsis sp. NPDC059657]|uniref:DNA glycosylase AlkZ-like family protein n=1 Tax=Amycolatopsis sp. NPDC059657 TaxID=3346899 RepID=UPI00366F1DB2
MLEVDRAQVMAYRIAAQGLHRGEKDAAKLAVFDLGVQDSSRDTALHALVARLAAPITGESFTQDERFALVWSHRGAQHFHRREDLAELTRSLVPIDEADAMARMGWNRKMVEAAAIPAMETLFIAARAMRKAVPKPTSKGDASTAVTKLVPEGLTYYCRGCQVVHILEQLFRISSLHGGIRLEPDATPAVLAPLEGRKPVSTRPDLAAATAVVRRYLHVNGPGTRADAAGFAGTTAGTVKSTWPDDLTEVRVEGKPAFLPQERVSELENPPEPDLVRLLPSWDPLLQARDRAILVPDRARQKEVWRMLGNPGVVLADGEIAGTWRAKAAGRKRLDFDLSPFETLPPAAREAAAEESERIATARGFADVRVAWS